MFEALGQGCSLLALGAPADAGRAFRAAAADQRAPLTVVEDGAGGETARYDAAHVVLRPDPSVAWSGEVAPSADEARLILGRAIGHVEAVTPGFAGAC